VVKPGARESLAPRDLEQIGEGLQIVALLRVNFRLGAPERCAASLTAPMTALRMKSGIDSSKKARTLKKRTSRRKGGMQAKRHGSNPAPSLELNNRKICCKANLEAQTMITVKNILGSKRHDIISITPDTTVYEALVIMSDKNIGALVVLDGETLVGIMSERDYARKVILHGKSSREMRVGEIMTSNVISVSPDQSVHECMGRMTDKHIRHLPVLENDRVVGIISIGDVVKAIISDQESTIKLLEEYISQ
jgi:CBS domain-containing protein